jgi:hypothetical protein
MALVVLRGPICDDHPRITNQSNFAKKKTSALVIFKAVFNWVLVHSDKPKLANLNVLLAIKLFELLTITAIGLMFLKCNVVCIQIVSQNGISPRSRMQSVTVGVNDFYG